MLPELQVMPESDPRDAASVALGLYAGILSASNLTAAAHRLVTHLARYGAYDRVTLGLHAAGHTRLLASSELDLTDPQADIAQLLLGALQEAVEQGSSLAYPTDQSAATTDTTDWIRLEQRRLQQHVGGAVATLPIGIDGTAFGAVCVERHGAPRIDQREMLQLERLVSLAGPALHWMQLGEQSWHQRMRQSIALTMASLRQPQRRTTRLLACTAITVGAFIALVPMEYAVGGRARVEGGQQRVMSAPSDGFIKTAHVRPGDRVLAGAPLVDLIEEDLQLESERWHSQLAQHENAYAAAMAKADRVGAATSFARVNEALAQLALIEEQRTRGRITAPFDALVVQGDLSQSIGAPVRQGDALLTLATTDHYRVMIEVDETDIARVQPGQSGQLVVSSLPWEHQSLVVERITPLAKAVEGRNIFEVQAQLKHAPTDQMRPGLLGRADVVVGRMPPLWAWTRHALARVQLAWWSWKG